MDFVNECVYREASEKNSLQDSPALTPTWIGEKTTVSGVRNVLQQLKLEIEFSGVEVGELKFKRWSRLLICISIDCT